MQSEYREVELSKRMSGVAAMVTKGNTVADIGCDHGFVSIYLVLQKICPKAIATDINNGPLLRAKEHVEEYGYSKYIETRRSDGLKAISLLDNDGKQVCEADTIIIAGMGGRLINKILEESIEKVRLSKEIILQPQSEIEKVREFLMQNQFQIINEDMVVEEGKYYQIIKAIPSDKCMKLDSVSMWYGPILLKEKHSVLRQYLILQQDKLLHILEEIEKNATTKKKQADIELLNSKLMRIKQALMNFS